MGAIAVHHVWRVEERHPGIGQPGGLGFDVVHPDGPRASVLSVLVFGDPLPLTRLAEVEQVTPPAITKTVTVLEAAGLVTRTRSDSDRRAVLVTATEAGRALLERGRAARVRVIADPMTTLPDADVKTLHRAAELIGSIL